MACDYQSGNRILIEEAIRLSTVLIITGVLISPIKGNKIKLFNVCFKLKTCKCVNVKENFCILSHLNSLFKTLIIILKDVMNTGRFKNISNLKWT